MDKLSALFRRIQDTTSLRNSSSEEPTELKCVLCGLYLSISPIYIVNNLGYICGRCELYKETIIQSDSTRAIAYEKLAQSVNFPCNNHKYGCKVTRRFNNIKSHEIACDFVPIYCPAIDCNKLLPQKKMKKHIKTEHDDLILNSSGYVKKQKDVKNEFVFNSKGCVIVVHMRFNCTQFLLALSYIKRSATKAKTFKINIHNYYNKYLTELEIKPYVCKYVPVDKMFPIQISFFYELINSLINLKLNSQACAVKTKEEGDLLYEVLKCPVCTQLMFPPIFQCKSGHYVCCNCKENNYYCGICAKVLSGTRNYALESLCDLIKIKCLNEPCTYEGTVLQLEAHLENCKFKHVLCPFIKNRECFWKGALKSLKTHLETEHNGKIIANNQLRKWKNNDSCEELNYFLIVEGNLFKLVRKVEKVNDDTLLQCFKVEHLIVNNNFELFMYTIEIIDEIRTNTCVLRLSALCCTQDDFEDDLVIKIPINSLNNFTDSAGCYTYKVFIAKVT